MCSISHASKKARHPLSPATLLWGRAITGHCPKNQMSDQLNCNRQTLSTAKEDIYMRHCPQSRYYGNLRTLVPKMSCYTHHSLYIIPCVSCLVDHALYITPYILPCRHEIERELSNDQGPSYAEHHLFSPSASQKKPPDVSVSLSIRHNLKAATTTCDYGSGRASLLLLHNQQQPPAVILW